jgi:phospholipase C
MLVSFVLVACFVTALVTSAEAEAAKKRISTVIVLMMENRSFDHMLGYAKGVDGVREGMSCPVDPNDVSKGHIEVFDGGYDVAPDDPIHNLDSIALQINGGKMDGFVASQINVNQNTTNPVAMFDKSSAPIINTLAEEYAVFDRWFASVPGPTDPNRQYAMAGTSAGSTTNFNGTLYTQQTYIDYLRRNGHTSGGYYERDLWMFGGFDDLVNNPENAKNIKELRKHFFTDLAAGNIPEFTWLQPSLSALPGTNGPSWQHPDASVVEGERLIKEIYEAIVKSPKWNETLFLITYDEHGGFYDHVAPLANVPSPDGIPCFDCSTTKFDFTELGVRVPTVAISPWITKGTVVSEGDGTPFMDSAFESTSLMATVNELLGVDAPPLGNRMAWASKFTYLLTENDNIRTDCLETLPDLPDAAHDVVDVQRRKPINEHMHAVLLFFCKQNYPKEFQEGIICKSAMPHTANQGLASDFMKIEQEKFMLNRQTKFNTM